MNFTDRSFVPLFAVTYVLWLLTRGRPQATLAVLLGASLYAYGHRQWELLVLLLGYCVVNWGLALAIERARPRRGLLALGVTLNLAALAFWKYVPFLVRSAIDAALALDLRFDVSPPSWVLPWGISFYTFTCIAYLVDVHRGDHPAERSLPRFVLFIAFFPHLVAGPILRGREFLDALQPESLPTRSESLFEALSLVARGAFKKLVLADRIALAIDPFFAHVADASTDGVWSLPFVWLYALQIYFDFSGYTDMARGIGLVFGFRWPENFFLPYLAGSVQEFWQRWHVTLSTFLRDYLYIPLGGSRLGNVRTYVNLFATMLLGGLWHGAAWSFLVWGALHGTFLAVHRMWAGTTWARRLRETSGVAGFAYRALAIGVTFHLVCLAWCFFRLTAFPESLACVAKWVPTAGAPLFVGGAADLSVWSALALYGICVLVGRRIAPNFAPAESDWRFGVATGGAIAALLLALVLSPGGAAPAFIYFQF